MIVKGSIHSENSCALQSCVSLPLTSIHCKTASLKEILHCCFKQSIFPTIDAYKEH